MVSIALPDAREAVVGSVGLLIIYYVLSYIYWQFTVGASRRRMIKEHGCKPVKRAPNMGPFGKLFFRRRYR